VAKNLKEMKKKLESDKEKLFREIEKLSG